MEPEIPLSMLPTAQWWLIADVAWVRPKRWVRRCALPMVGPLAAGGDPIDPEQLPPGARTLETFDMLLPGLHNAHVHAGLVDLREVRRAGIAAVTDLGGVPAQLAELHRQSLVLDSDLPAISFAGAFLTAPGGYPSDRSWAAPGSWRAVRSVADAETAVAEQHAAGAGLIKIAINVNAGPVLGPAELAAIAAAGHALDLVVVAHAEGEGAVRAALDAGVDVLAHVPWTEPLEPDLIRESARQTTWISTLEIHHPRANPTVWETSGTNLVLFLEAGGTVRYGTDLGNGWQPLGVNSHETLALQTLDLSVDEVLDAMTGPLTGPAATKALPSKFVPGVAPCLLPDPITRRQRVIGPAMRDARVLSLEAIHDIEIAEGL